MTSPEFKAGAASKVAKAISPRETVFVLGNGPSLASVSLPSLSPFPTIGMNAAYRYWRTIDWRPTFYTCLDTVVGLSHKTAIAELIQEERIEKFLLRSNLIDALGPLSHNARIINFDAVSAYDSLLSALPITTGSHAALWAASMGFKQILLLGIDLDYTEVVGGARRRDGIELEIVESVENPNYFFKEYQQPGDRYNVPNPRPDLHVHCWRTAAQSLKATPAQIYQTNQRSNAAFFPYVPLKDFLSDGGVVHPPAEEVSQPSIDLATNSSRSVSSPEPGKTSRVKAFLGKYGLVFTIGLIAGIGLSLIGFFGFGVQVAFGIAGLAGLAWITAITLAYTRHVTIEHLANIERRLSQTEARLQDLERTRRIPSESTLNP